MNTNLKLYFFIFFMTISGHLIGQTYNSDSSSATTANLQSTAAQLSVLSSKPSRAFSNSSISSNNAIFIQQIGNYNKINTNTLSVKSDIKLFQNGNSNDIALNIRSGIINERVIQNGFNNSFIDLSVNGSRYHNAKVIQQGTGQRLLWYGNNSISDRMIISMKGKGQTILVRNIR